MVCIAYIKFCLKIWPKNNGPTMELLSEALQAAVGAVKEGGDNRGKAELSQY